MLVYYICYLCMLVVSILSSYFFNFSKTISLGHLIGTVNKLYIIYTLSYTLKQVLFNII
jgi:hypothetical protein